MNKNKPLTEILNIKYPVIMAPMFLVSNAKMIIEACNNGIAGAIPALNYRTDEALREGIKEMQVNCKGPIGINLIVNKSNPKMAQQLKTSVELGVDFILTSLGSPKSVIDACRPKGIKVFCDVTDLKFAQKVESLGADAIIAVNNEAGGHKGNVSPEDLISDLVKNCNIPVISAGGVGNKAEMDRMLRLGASGVSVGSIFIASNESSVSQEYKQACVDYGEKDIVMSTKISGTPCTVINTPYVKKIGTSQGWLENLLSKNKKLKKWVKMFTFVRGMKSVEKAATSATYKTVWVAGTTIEHTKAIKSVKEIINDLVK
jgi:nitronate monooxygenase